MLKLFQSSKTRANLICRHISTSRPRRQNSELAQTREHEHGIRAIEKKPARAPLVKNFLVAQVDTDLMAYPEAIYETEHSESAKKQKKLFEDFLAANTFENPDDVNNVAMLKEFGSFKNNSTLITESLFNVSESASQVLSYGTFLNGHQQVLRLVNQFGSASQKLKFVPKLESGDFIGAPALFEAKPPENRKPFVTEAKFIDDSKSWVLNGEKSFILLPSADKDSSLFLVIATSDCKDRVGDYVEGLTALLVEGSLPGVTIKSADQTIGCTEKAFKQVAVSFKDVTLDESCVLCENGSRVVNSYMSLNRLEKGVQAMAGIMKPLIKELVDHSINTKIQGINMKDVDTIKEQLGALAVSYYALESMVYMTAGLIDIYENQDVELETAMVQSFAMQAMTDFMIRPLHAVGPRAVIKDSVYERYIRDATHLAASCEHLDSIRQFIALCGLQHAGLKLGETVMKSRNPLNHPSFIFSRMFNETSIERPKKKFNLEHYLHPSLETAAEHLEHSILRLSAVADILLARHGPLVVEHTVEVAKLADAATLCYAMFATAARASRSYCIGLRNADQEIHLANYFCFHGMKIVKQIAKDLDNGEYGCGEATFKIIGEKLIETKQYHLEHPTARNF